MIKASEHVLVACFLLSHSLLLSGLKFGVQKSANWRLLLKRSVGVAGLSSVQIGPADDAVFGIAISLAELDGGQTFDVEAQETELGLVIIDRRNQLCEGHADGVTSKPKASVAISIPV